jgi:hypothetical protein
MVVRCSGPVYGVRLWPGMAAPRYDGNGIYRLWLHNMDGPIMDDPLTDVRPMCGCLQSPIDGMIRAIG